jgi:RNA methyltransferase, TrmH family
MHPLITSPQNPKIKSIAALDKARERKSRNVFLIEGVKELGLAMSAGYNLVSVYFCPSIISEEAILQIVQNERLLIPVDAGVFEKIAYRESTGGIIAVAEQRAHTLNNVRLPANPLILVVEGVEKPGNLGALLRTADAAGIDAVVVCDPQTDFYNPNVVRASIGCVFTTQLASCTSEEAISWLKEQGIKIYSTYLKAAKPYHTIDYTQPSAIVMGTESTGLSSLWIENASANIVIPMQGQIDSMNVSTAAAVVIFEAKRQRNFQ